MAKVIGWILSVVGFTVFFGGIILRDSDNEMISAFALPAAYVGFTLVAIGLISWSNSRCHSRHGH